MLSNTSHILWPHKWARAIKHTANPASVYGSHILWLSRRRHVLSPTTPGLTGHSLWHSSTSRRRGRCYPILKTAMKFTDSQQAYTYLHGMLADDSQVKVQVLYAQGTDPWVAAPPRPTPIPVLVGSYGSERTQPSFPRWRRGPETSI